MKKNLIQDERAILQKRKIGSDTCTLLLVALLVSLLFQQYVLNAPFSQYAAEFICFIGAGLYILVRNLIAGNNLYGESYRGKKATKLILINSIVAGLTLCVITGISNYARYGGKYTGGTLLITLAITFFSAAAGMYVTLSLLYYLNRRRQEKITEELDKKERDID